MSLGVEAHLEIQEKFGTVLAIQGAVSSIPMWVQYGTAVFKGNLLIFGVLGTLIIYISTLCHTASRKGYPPSCWACVASAGKVCSEISL